MWVNDNPRKTIKIMIGLIIMSIISFTLTSYYKIKKGEQTEIKEVTREIMKPSGDQIDLSKTRKLMIIRDKVNTLIEQETISSNDSVEIKRLIKQFREIQNEEI